MKRSVPIDFIKDELLEIFENRKFSNETDEAYYKRKAAGILDMLEGLGMLPPPKNVDCVTDYLLYAYYDTVEPLSDDYDTVNTTLLWSKEDEK